MRPDDVTSLSTPGRYTGNPAPGTKPTDTTSLVHNRIEVQRRPGGWGQINFLLPYSSSLAPILASSTPPTQRCAQGRPRPLFRVARH
jgi:hypothetical protein